MSDKILKEHADFAEVATMFNALKEKIRSEAEDKSKPGFGGMFTAEEKKTLEDISFSMFSGGYEQQLASKRFGFNLNETYTYSDGTAYVFYKGDIENLKEAYKEVFKVDIDAKPSVRRPKP